MHRKKQANPLDLILQEQKSIRKTCKTEADILQHRNTLHQRIKAVLAIDHDDCLPVLVQFFELCPKVTNKDMPQFIEQTRKALLHYKTKQIFKT